ncbi:MAG: biotin--[acetyl-CoA-carboxylase] ligase [Sphingomicrobium sp.]
MAERTGSTSADLLAAPESVEGDWLVARSQDAGRGRHGRAWTSLKGNFFGSTLVMLGAGDPLAQTLSLGAGVALIEAVAIAVPGLGQPHAPPLLLKWPNDLLLDGRKLAGILLERSGDRIVVGFGVNLAAAPDLDGRTAASLEGAVTPEGFAPLLAASFARMLARWRGGDPAAVATAWLARAHPLGAALTVHTSADESLGGAFDGLEPDGALRLRTGDGVRIVRAGDVSL